MSELIRYSQPAERDRGLSWADRFESQALVESNGGVVAGTPTFSPSQGVTLDGAADYLTYALTGQEFDSAALSIVCEFSPNFEPTEDTFRYLFDSTNGSRFRVNVDNNAASDTLSIMLGSVTIASIPLATYQAAWVTSGRNVLVISGTTGDTSMWLNGTLILNASAIAWSAKAPTEFYAGAHYAGGNKFDGTIHRLQVFKTQLADSLALALSNGEANVLPLVGAVPNSTPAERDAGLSWGWSSEVALDGTNDYFEEALTGGEFDSASVSIVCAFTPDFAPDDGADHILYDNDPAADRFLCIKRAAGIMTLYLGGTDVATIALATYEGAWVTNGRNVLVISGTSGANKAWLNGILIATSATAWTQKRPTSFFAGSYRTAGAGKFDGQIHLIQVYKAQLSDADALQISNGVRLT